MNGLKASLSEIREVSRAVQANSWDCEVLICPPATILAAAAQICAEAEGVLKVGGQDCHVQEKGAHTGDISAPMLADAGGSYIIVGHSERRADHHENDGLVNAKARACLDAGLTPIICVGETHAQRLEALAITVVEHQLDGSVPELRDGESVVIAYEPVWAIGTGLVPDEEDIARMHAAIREWLVRRFGKDGEQVRILYGGSMKPDNASQILTVPNVNGGLIGGASLKAQDFLGIVKTT